MQGSYFNLPDTTFKVLLTSPIILDYNPELEC